MNEELIIFIVTMALTFIPVGILLAYMPYLTRRTENFGVSIPASMYDRDDFQTMRTQYKRNMLISLGITTAILGVLCFILTTEMLYILFSIIIFLYLISGFLLYLPFHNKMKRIKQTEDWHDSRKQSYVIDMKFRDEKITLSNGWYLVPAILTIITAAIPFLFYDAIPDMLPMHTDFTGNVTYKEKSIANLLIMPGIQLFMLVLFIGTNYVIKVAKQQVSVENPEQSRQQNITFRKKWSVLLFVMGTLTVLLLMYFQIGFLYEQLLTYDMYVIIGYTALILFGTIWLSVTTGQGGSRVKSNKNKDETVIDRDDDAFWKWGQFYYNKNDPAIFIEKRFGIGWTNNWAHPLSWVLIIGILVICFAPLIFI